MSKEFFKKEQAEIRKREREFFQKVNPKPSEEERKKALEQYKRERGML